MSSHLTIIAVPAAFQKKIPDDTCASSHYAPSMAKPSNVVELLQDLVAIPSVNPEGHPGTNRTGEQGVADYVADFLRTCGAEVLIRHIDIGRPNVIATFTPDKPAAHLAFAPHLDTVSVAGMTIPPFVPAIRDG